MAFKEVASLDCDTTITLGGKDKKTGKSNPKQIEGYFLGTREIGPNKFNKQKVDVVHVFQTKDGNVGVWGKTDLDTKLKNAIPGRMVRATFTGSIPTNKGNDMLKFKVEVDNSNTIDVSDLVAQNNDADDSTEGYEDNYPAGDNDDVGNDEPEAQSYPVVAASTATDRANKVKELLNRKNKVS